MILVRLRSVSGLILFGIFQQPSKEGGSVPRLYVDCLGPSLKNCGHVLRQYQVTWGKGSPGNPGALQGSVGVYWALALYTELESRPANTTPAKEISFPPLGKRPEDIKE